MVVPIRELVNTSCSIVTKALSTKPMANISVNIDMDIDNNIPRGRSKSPLSNSSRDSSVFSQVSSILYQRMEIQNNNLLQSNQVKEEKIALSYTTNAKENNIPAKQATDNSPKVEAQYEINEALALNNTPLLQGECEAINNANIYT